MCHTKEVNNVDISGLWQARGGKYFGRGRTVSGGPKNKAADVGHVSSRSHCAVGSSRLSLCCRTTSRKSQPAHGRVGSTYSFCCFLSFLARRLSSKFLSSLTGKESQPVYYHPQTLCSNPRELTGTSGNLACKGGKGTKREHILLTAALWGSRAQRVTFVPESKL